MKKIIISIAILLIIALGTAYLIKTNTTDSTAEIPAPDSQELLSYFTSMIIANATSTIANYEKLGLGGDIDGFTLLTLYPNLKPADFANVRAYQGNYSVVNGKLTFTGDAASNSAVLKKEGMETLLTNVSTRLQIPVADKTNINALIAKMNTSEPLAVRIGEVATSLGIYVTPTDVIEDSRCPANANCIQAGTVRIQAMLESGSGRAPQTFTLNQPITTETREVTLVQVEPQSQAGVKIKNSEYVFYFEIMNR